MKSDNFIVKFLIKFPICPELLILKCFMKFNFVINAQIKINFN